MILTLQSSKLSKSQVDIFETDFIADKSSSLKMTRFQVDTIMAVGGAVGQKSSKLSKSQVDIIPVFQRLSTYLSSELNRFQVDTIFWRNDYSFV